MRARTFAAAAAALMFALAGAGLAQPSARAAAPEGLQAENLLVAVPQGFKVGVQGGNGPMTGAEYVPADETVKDWTRRRASPRPCTGS